MIFEGHILPPANQISALTDSALTVRAWLFCASWNTELPAKRPALMAEMINMLFYSLKMEA